MTDSTVLENLQFVAGIYRIKSKEQSMRIRELLALPYQLPKTNKKSVPAV
ncbi:MAG: hypothetical protein U5L01_07360 [Rheinheimera sp.]|nr:hypothetical protein [Rheinheimera sp.]